MNRTDALTKLANRRFFMESFSREYERAKRYGEPLSYVMCDLDKFKSVNDNYGHIAGDNALVVAAKGSGSFGVFGAGAEVGIAVGVGGVIGS